jgi:hypothetical protein
MAMHLGRVYLPHPVRNVIFTISLVDTSWLKRNDVSFYPPLRLLTLLFCCPCAPIQDGDNFFFETQIEFCRNAKRFEPGMNCFYQAYSKCTIKDATANVGTFRKH